MIAQGLFEHLQSDAGVSAIAGDRIFPGFIPQRAYDDATRLPCLVYQFPSSIRQPLFCATDATVAQSTQIDCYARAYPLARQLAAAVRDAMIDFAGQMGSVEVKKVLMDTDFDSVDQEPGLFRVTQLYTVWFVET